MKKMYLIFTLIILLSGLCGCMRAPSERGPLVVKNPRVTVTPLAKANSSIGSTDMINIDSSAEIAGSEDEQKKGYIVEYYSELGYHLKYDSDFFTVSSKDGIDTYIGVNNSPDMYPYVYISIKRKNLPTAVELLSLSGNPEVIFFSDKDDILKNYISSDFKMMTGTKTKTHVYIKYSEAESAPIKQTTVGNLSALYYRLTYGSDWNSVITDYYFLPNGEDQELFCLEVNYYTNVSENFGTKITDMLDSFEIK